MPCESAAAGLVALGVMRRRLSEAGASDAISHYQRIERLVASRKGEIFLRHKFYKGRFIVEAKDHDGVMWVRNEATDNSRLSNRTRVTRTVILPSKVCDWHFDGEAPVQTDQGSGLPYRALYEQLVSRTGTISSNFNHSDSWICLAGCVAGESVSKSTFAGIRFQYHNEAADLSQLLTIQDWTPRTVSRVNFLNSRTGKLDRNSGLTRLVIADGDAAFLKALEAPEFTSSDLVGVINRVVARENLEAIGAKLSALTQWYVPDPADEDIKPPVGVTISQLRRKQG